MTTPDASSARELAGLLRPGFVVGAATAALQIEGDASGRGLSGWDAFAAQPGRILDCSTPADTARHVEHLDGDIALLTDAGFDAYRFSISWPRVERAGLDFYDRLLDRLLAAGIRPMATLYHWDTPVALEEQGGWLRRATAERFGEHVARVGAALGDRVADWVTINEPATVVLNGYALGLHAPGLTRGLRAGVAARNLLLAHGYAVQALRSVPVAGRIGITNVHTPVTPATTGAEDVLAAALLDFVHNRQYADPVLRGRAPSVPAGLPLSTRIALRLTTRLGRRDLELIGQPLDFYGLNYYFPSRVAAGPDPTGASPDGHSPAMADGPLHLVPWPDLPTTGFGWPVSAEGLRTTVDQLHERYPDMPPIAVTESGSAWPDVVADDGSIDDADRTAYLSSHLAVAATTPGVEAYYAWSLLDNWEWAAGFTQRFGLVHVDFATGARTPKASWRFLRELQAARRAQ
jgi:beta-glucosidase